MESAVLQTLIGMLMGAASLAAVMLAIHISRSSEPRVEPSDRPLLNPSVTTVLSVLRSSAVVLNGDDEVVRASAPAYALGLVRGNNLIAEDLVSMVAAVRRDGQIREAELEMSRDNLPTRFVTARVAQLNSRLVLVLVEDRTNERRVEEIRKDFVGNVSHELKTPIGAIRVLAEATTEACEDPATVRRFSERISKESDRLQRLVQQILDLARLQDDAPLEMPSAVSVDEVIAIAIDTCAIDAEHKEITVEHHGDRAAQVPGNRDQLVAAVANLVANAVSYSSPGSAVVVETKTQGATIEISVTDRGIGIPADELDRIFERFYRVDPARHRSTGGTGLGLSIVKHIAATHGGDVQVRSVEGRGSTFYLNLPLSVQVEEAG